MNVFDVIVIGAGLSGCVIAERFSNVLHKKVLIVEKRNHIGGNCYDYIDDTTGIRVNKYGAHAFHTNDEEVWKYINIFGEWIRYDWKVVASINNRMVPIPVNMETINVLNNQNLQTEEETKLYLESIQEKNSNPQNSEEMALSRVGKKMYETLFLPYTKKQWNCDPKDLDASVLARIPVRYNMDSRYFNDKYQAIPKNGYTKFFEKLICNPNITLRLNTDLEFPIDHPCVIYTGPIDEYFKNAGLPKLEYRSLQFEYEYHYRCGFKQQNTVVNYPEQHVPYTRIIEYKHLPYSEHLKTEHTILVKEYPSDIGEPYYPVPSSNNQELYEKYRNLAEKSGVHMLGRLANYKYFNMDQAIRNSLDYFDTHFK